MQTPEDVAQMLRLKAAGLGIKQIARKRGCSKNTSKARSTIFVGDPAS